MSRIPDERFSEQARRASRYIGWRFDAAFATFLVVYFAMIAVVAFLIVPAIGITVFLIVLAMAWYSVWRFGFRRVRDLTCPNCNVRGEVLKVEQTYEFHCPKCGQAADTGYGSWVVTG